MTIHIDSSDNGAEWLVDEQPGTEEPTEKEWVAYEGPRGGTGWQNTRTEDVVYADEPPEEDGGGDSEIGILDQLESELNDLSNNPVDEGGWVDAPEEYSEIDVGTPVSLWDDDEWQNYEGIVLDHQDSGVLVGVEGEGVWRVDGDADLDPDDNLYIQDVWDEDYDSEADDETEDDRMSDEEVEEFFDQRLDRLPDVNQSDVGETGYWGDGAILESEDVMGADAEDEDVVTLIDTVARGEFKDVVADTTDAPDDGYGPWTVEGNYMNPAEPKAVVYMDADDWLTIQHQMVSGYEDAPSFDHWIGSARPEDVTEYADHLQDPEAEDFTMPYLILNQDGETVNHQEGRHRGLAAKEAGMDELPILVTLDPDRTTKAAGQCPVPAPNPLRKEWRPYEGPQGGEGWYHPSRDEVRYTDDPPDEVGHAFSEMANTGYISTPDAPDLRIHTADRKKDLYSDPSAQPGASAAHMDVYYWDQPDGGARRAYVTNYGTNLRRDQTGEKPTLGERAIAGDAFLRNIGMGEFVPKHYFDREDMYLSVDGANGVEATKYPDFDVNEEEFKTFAAAAILMGNSDLHGHNVMVRGEGEFKAVDIDKSGGDFTESSRFRRRGVKALKRTGDALGIALSREELDQRCQELAQEIDIEEALTGVQNSRYGNKPRHDFRENIRANIEAFKNGSVL